MQLLTSHVLRFPARCHAAAAFRESIHMGETDMTAAQVQHLVQQMGHHYKGNKYHLLQLNCNHFASDMCLQLTGKPAPPWVSIRCAADKGHSIVRCQGHLLAASACSWRAAATRRVHGGNFSMHCLLLAVDIYSQRSC